LDLHKKLDGVGDGAGDHRRHSYAAPEILAGQDFGVSADIFSLGCLLVRLGLTKPLYTDEMAALSWDEFCGALWTGDISPVDAMRREARASANPPLPVTELAARCCKVVPRQRVAIKVAARMLESHMRQLHQAEEHDKNRSSHGDVPSAGGRSGMMKRMPSGLCKPSALPAPAGAKGLSLDAQQPSLKAERPSLLRRASSKLFSLAQPQVTNASQTSAAPMDTAAPRTVTFGEPPADAPADVVPPPLLTWSELPLNGIVGEGPMGIVLASTLDGKAVAVRRFGDLVMQQYDSADELKAELEALCKVQGAPNLLQCMAIVDDPSSEHQLGVVVPRVMESLSHRLRDVVGDTPLMAADAAGACSIVLQTASALGHLHVVGLYHGSLWPANVMLRVEHGNVEVELSDYGRSKKLVDMILRREAAETDGRAEVRGEVGAGYTAALAAAASKRLDRLRRPYAAPEMLNLDASPVKHISWERHVDTYALGCLLARLASPNALYTTELKQFKTWPKVYAALAAGDVKPTAAAEREASHNRKLPKALVDLAVRCVALDKRARLKMGKCVETLQELHAELSSACTARTSARSFESGMDSRRPSGSSAMGSRRPSGSSLKMPSPSPSAENLSLSRPPSAGDLGAPHSLPLPPGAKLGTSHSLPPPPPPPPAFSPPLEVHLNMSAATSNATSNATSAKVSPKETGQSSPHGSNASSCLSDSGRHERIRI
jgi:serine/threonine protein kinase